MATLGGARAMGLGDLVGSIEAGKQADLACVDLDPLETQPMYHAVSQLVYATGRHQVSDVWVAGVRKLAQGRLVDMDTDAIRAKARRWRARIAGIGTPS
jgi:5-methylthioadenosine/S-adenosylhomocysteine deaminase